MVFLSPKGGLNIHKSCNRRDAGFNSRTENEKTKKLAHAPKISTFHSCHYCGKIHAEDFICPKKPVYKKRLDEIIRFRNSPKWQNKRKQIKKRDNYLCQICIRNLYNTIRQYNADKLEVHHVIPIKTDKDSKLDSNNLITLCSYHHELCEKGKIPSSEVKKIALEQENLAANSSAIYF